jgi:galactitol-specific phosphotransferase system IIB component
MKAPNEVNVEWGPCCFCGAGIATSTTDPCRLTVETASGKWQVWFCHGQCFKDRLAQLPDNLDFFAPAHF